MKTMSLMLLSGLAVLALGLWACGGEPPQAEAVPRPVRYQQVSSGVLETSRTFAGVAKAGVEAELSFRVAGTLEEVMVTLGDQVRRGERLARLDAVDYELQTEEAEAGLAQARAALRKAESDFERTRALYENNNASKSELDAARAGAESARSQVNAADKRLELTRQRLAYTVLRAPADGAIAGVHIEPNENIRAGQPAFLLTAGSAPEVEFLVPEALIADLKVGMPVVVTLDALPGRSLAAEIAEVGVAVTGASAAFEATARLLEEVADVRSGMAAEVSCRFATGGGIAGLTVPWVAVGEDRQGTYVYVLEPRGPGEGVVSRRSVTVGEVGEKIQILEGLSEGELVVTAGTRRLSDGMRVRMDEDAGAGA